MKDKKIEGALREVPALDADTNPVPDAARRAARNLGRPFSPQPHAVVVDGNITMEDYTGQTTAGLETPQLGPKLGLVPLPVGFFPFAAYLVPKTPPLPGYRGLLSQISVLVYRASDKDHPYGSVHASPLDLLSRPVPTIGASFSDLLYTLQCGDPRQGGRQYPGAFGAVVHYFSFDHGFLAEKKPLAEILQTLTESSSEELESILASRGILAHPLFSHEDVQHPERSLNSQLVLRRFRQSVDLD